MTKTSSLISEDLLPSINGDSSNGNEDEFEAFYNSICEELQSKGEVGAVSKAFGTLKTDTERMTFVLTKPLHYKKRQREELHYQGKDRAESVKARNAGNAAYKVNQIEGALELYCKSICYAPHPNPTISIPSQQDDGGSENHFEELSLGYANRSAVLFQMKEYELCVRDITRSFDNGYPNNLMYKLFERKARCLKALKDYPRALESMKNAEMWMKYSTLSETKSSDFKKDIKKQIEFLEEKVNGITDLSELSSNMIGFKKSLMAPVRVLKVPELPNEAHSKEVLGARSNIKLKFSKDKGRHLVATSDIEAGELLITETPYSAVLLPEYYNTHCQSCFQRIWAPIPCWCCSKVRFCSDECRLEAWDRFHKIECQQLDLILNSGVGKNAMLAMRILTSSGKIYLEYVIEKLLSENEKRRTSGASEEEATRMLGFNEENKYCPADYRTIYTLVTNSEQRGVGDLFKRTLMALYLLNVLEMTPFFYNGGSDPRNVNTQDKVMMGAVILKHLQNLPCNAHEISEIEYSNCNLRESTVHEIGAACYGVLSLCNHSCDPNVVRHYYGQDAALRSIRLIKEGQEILDNYGYHYAIMPKAERTRKLYNQYYFHCKCSVCSDSWPLYTSLPTSPNLSSPEFGTEISKSSKNFRKLLDDFLNGSEPSSVQGPFLEHLRLLEKAVVRPYKEYNDAQEALKQCYSLQGNSFKKNPPSNPVTEKKRHSQSSTKWF
eukprot:TRINITY_DN5339_c0_g1_i1.p1 TRINITY_DN5339_c0_g1~~TRINITY_DN5339_c0_g1_i1.p1  ORF type:complete len:721 (-),score=210.74 TRINITY_DN5339_c0_g1_i1:943-3105(-)